MRMSGGESEQDCNNLFIAAEGGSRTVWRGRSMTVVRIQCYSSAREERRRDKSLPEGALKQKNLIETLCYRHFS
jgi:hypothetical protein